MRAFFLRRQDRRRRRHRPVRLWTMLEDTPDGLWVSGLPPQARLITVGQVYVRDGQAVAATLVV